MRAASDRPPNAFDLSPPERRDRIVAGMRRASVDEYVRDPVGRYVTGRWFLVWADSPRLAGSAFFGRPDTRELPDVVRVTSLPETWSDRAGYDVLVDWSKLEGLEPAAFSGFVAVLRQRVQAATRLRRAAIVRAPGMTGAVIAGVFHDEIRADSRAALFADREEALAWLGVSGDPRARIERVLRDHLAEPTLLRTLRARLADSPRSASLPGEARALGVSERTLSRQLQAEGTSFRAELERARLRAAESLLVQTDLKLETIARQIGFTSRTHFSQFFRGATGETPSGFRAHRKPRERPRRGVDRARSSSSSGSGRC